MANISSSFGTITLKGDWTDEQIKKQEEEEFDTSNLA